MANEKISVVIPHVPVNKSFDDMLDDCVKSLDGYSELVLVVNDGIGYGKSFNKGFRLAKGDFIIAVSNDTILEKGNLQDLCDNTAVTYSENAQWGCFFCLPRWVLSQIGGFDERFTTAFFEDDNYLSRLRRAGIPYRRVPDFIVQHKGGLTVKAISSENELMQKNRPIFEQIEKELDEGKGLYQPL